MNIKKLIFIPLLGILICATAFVAAARTGLLTPSDEVLRQKYGLSESRFVDIDGQVVHYTDQGHGDAIVLIHGSFGSLRMWSDWVQVLSRHYRVIRFDRPPMGLAGAHPKGDYSVEQEMLVMQKLLALLHVDRFVLVATSSGGESGAAYTALHADQVRAAIFSNIAAEPFKPDQSHRPATLRFLIWVQPLLKGWKPALFWREVLEMNFYDQRKVTDAMAKEWADLNNRAQRTPRQAPSQHAAVPFTRTPSDLARITVPTLLLWSDHDVELPAATVAARVLALLGSSDKAIQIVPDCGHMMPLECGPQSVAIAEAFLQRVAPPGPGR